MAAMAHSTPDYEDGPTDKPASRSWRALASFVLAASGTSLLVGTIVVGNSSTGRWLGWEPIALAVGISSALSLTAVVLAVATIRDAGRQVFAGWAFAVGLVSAFVSVFGLVSLIAGFAT